MGVSTSEWPQVEERVTMMPGSHHHQQHQSQHSNLHLHGATAGASSVTTTAAAGRAMDNQQALKCPRCDSSNTKFCYYNNYSLSQPRHFCKACKRYWTRGGTLRNVPVGGGCRKNKRIKRTSSTSGAATDSPSLPRQISNVSLLQSSSTTTMDPIFYGLIHNNSGDLNRAADFPSLLKRLEQRNLMCNLNSCTDLYDFNPQLGSLGLCFPTTTTAATTHQDFNAVQFHTPDLSTAALVTTTASTSLVHDYSLLGSSLSSSTATSLLAAGLRPQPKMGAVNNPSGWVDIQGAEASANGSSGLFKGEDGANVLSHDGRLEWQIPCENSQLNDVGAVDGMSLYWNVNAASGVGGGWTETATNCGSSIAPLI